MSNIATEITLQDPLLFRQAWDKPHLQPQISIWAPYSFPKALRSSMAARPHTTRCKFLAPWRHYR